MKKQLIIIGLAGLISTGFACKKESGKEVAEEFGKKMCYKMAECAQEQLKSIPEAQRQMAMNMLPTKEKCEAAQKEARSNDKSQVKELTKDQIAQAKKCMAAMEKISCGDMQKGIPECEEFSKTMH
jgi:hypothetical protein